MYNFSVHVVALLQSKPMGAATYGEHMGRPCDPHTFPIRSPYVRHMGKISKTTKSFVAHMLSKIWGNLWATQQHMGKCGHFCIQISFSEHIGSIWGTYWQHMGNIWGTYGNIWGTYGKHMGNIWGAHQKQYPTKYLPSPADATPSKTVRLPPSLF